MSDAVWLDVLPSMGGFATKLAKESTAAADTAGKSAGKAWSDAVTGGAKGGAALVADLEAAQRKSAAVVKELAGKISEARASERAAAANVLTAEQRLTDARAKYGNESNQAQAAELKLEAARARAAGAADRYKSAESALRAAQREHTTVAGQLEQATKDLDNTVERGPSLWQRLKASMSQASDQAEKTSAGAGRVEGSLTRVGATAGAVAGIVGNVFDRAVDSIAQLGGEAVTASDATDKFRNTLDFAGLDTGTIANVTKQTRAYADQTVYDLSDIQNITAQLASNGIADYEGLAEAAGNLNAIAGGNAETFKSVGMVLTQTAGQGKLTTENWNQLADAIPGASGKLQKSLLDAGAYTGNFREAMEKGQITAEEFNAALLDLGSQPVAAEAAKSTSTFEGALGNLKATVVGGLSDALTAFKPQITGAIGWVSDFVTGLKGVIAIFTEGDFKGAAATFGWAEDSTQVTVLFTIRDWLVKIKDVAADALRGFGDYVTGTVVPAAQALGGWLADHREWFVQIRDVATGALRGFGDYLTGTVIPGAKELVGWLVDNRDWIAAVGVAVGTVLVVWKAYQGALLAWQVATKAAAAVQTAFNIVMNANPIMLIVTAVAALVAGLVYFFTQTDTGKRIWADFTSFLSQTWDTITSALTTAWNAIAGFFSGLWDGIKAVFSGVWDFLQAWFSWTPLGLVIENWGAIRGWFSDLWDGVKGFFSDAWDFMKEVFSWTPLGLITENWGAIVSFFAGLPGRIADAASGLWDGIKNSFKDAINWVIRKWNDFGITLGGGRILGVDIPEVHLDTPNIPLLADGGTIRRGGWSIVGEAGPELLNLSPGAQVVPLDRSAGARGGGLTQVFPTTDPLAAAAEALRLQKWEGYA